MQEIVFYFQRETQKSKIQIVHNATPPTRQCATSRRSRCTRDHARCVPAHLPLLGSCHRTQQDLKWLRVRCPTLEAATTLMLTRTALSLSAWVAICGGESMSATATTTTMAASHSSTAWKGLGILNLLMFQVETY